jgi:hypothetical protein
MSNPRSEPRQRDLEDALRRALRTAADSVEPAADGLDRIRSRICARRPVPTGWNMAELAGPAVNGNPVLRNLLPVSIAAQAAFHAVVQRLRPGPDGIGWYRWLRSAAALATAFVVVLAGSWAITALPQVIAPSASNGSAPGSGGGRVPVTSSSGPAAPRTGSQSPVASPSYPTSSATYPTGHRGKSSPSASSPSASPALSSSPSAGPAPSSSPSASPAPSSSPSASPTPSASCSPSASPSPSASNSHGNKRHCHHRRHHKRR